MPPSHTRCRLPGLSLVSATLLLGASLTGGPGATPATAATATCPPSTRTVSTATALRDAIATAKPGDVIGLNAGTYGGGFALSADGTLSAPITLCGTSAAVIDGGGLTGSYGLHLNGANYWRIMGVTVTRASKGIVLDYTTGTEVTGVTVKEIGDEGIHLRRWSKDNVVGESTISRTGRINASYGEGIYVGSARSNWCTYTKCKPDASDRNHIRNNTIFDTAAESVDIKEGTTGGILSGNRFDGSGMSSADSWVDVKGNAWTVQGNTGVTAPQDGFQTHVIRTGWGANNKFLGNVAEVRAGGYGYKVQGPAGNIVACNNQVSYAGSGLSNVRCTP